MCWSFAPDHWSVVFCCSRLTLERDFVLTRPLHRLRFEAERVPDAFKNNPVAPKYSFDPEGVREILGDEMSGGGYEEKPTRASF